MARLLLRRRRRHDANLTRLGRKPVGSIDFEVLHFDELFKLEQKSLDWIEKVTGLQFPIVLRDADTFATPAAPT